MERDLRDETMSHDETNPDTKDVHHSAKVYGGNLILYVFCVFHTSYSFFTLHACARGKAIGSVRLLFVRLSAQKSPDLEI